MKSVQRKLGVPLELWTVKEHTVQRKRGLSDAFEYQLYEVPLSGLLHSVPAGDLEFLDGRLVRLTLFPSNMQALLQRIGHPVAGLKLSGKSLQIGHVNIMNGTDYRGRPFLSWQDERLVDRLRSLVD